MACATVYLGGGVFFTTGGYVSVLQAVNEPSESSTGARPAGSWWARQPRRRRQISAA